MKRGEMAENNRGCNYSDLWRIWKESPHYRPQIEHWMALDKNLPILSWKVQLEVLDNCPMEIVKAHAHLLHDKVKRELGIEDVEQRRQKKTRASSRWSYQL
jgi:hypothetical protein